MTSSQFLSGVDIRINGSSLEPTIAAQVLEVRVETRLMLPSMFSLRIPDPEITLIDDERFKIGTVVEILFQAADKAIQTRVFSGQITSLEPDFSESGAFMGVRGYDRGYLLNATPRTDTYQSVTFADIARKVAMRGQLTAGTISVAGGVHQFVQQSNETDWAFLWRLASSIGYEVVVDATKLHFRPAGGPPGSRPIPLAWGVELLSFRPRATGIRQVKSVVVRGWDPVAAKTIVATARNPATTSQIGLARQTVISAVHGDAVAVCDRPVSSQAHADAVAAGIAEQLANSFVDASGLAHGDPRLCAGAKVAVKGVGTRFGGTYALSETTHVFRSGRGYHTQLRVTGQAIPDPGRPARQPGWHHTIVVGVVTNNLDPQGLGRIRVKYPGLGPTHEGWWARLTAPSAGTDRGLMMLPIIGDEVVLGFEHDSTEHPYILGSVWNGQARPDTLVAPDGSFSLRSDKQLTAKAAEQITVDGQQAVSIQAGTDIAIKAIGQLTAEAATASVKANGKLTLQGVAEVKMTGAQTTVEGQALTRITAGGTLNMQSGGPLEISGALIQIKADSMVEIIAPQIKLG